MSDDEADPELLELLRQRLGISSGPPGAVPCQTGVLEDAEFIYHNAIDVHVDMYGTKGAASEIYRAMKARGYSTETWSTHELHPKPSEGFAEVDMVNFVFTMDLLNFSFWSELSSEDRFQVEYSGQRWTGYNSLVACLRRALDEGIPITTPRFWTSPRCTDETLNHAFRSATSEPIPLRAERIAILKEASTVLQQEFADDWEAHQFSDEEFEESKDVALESVDAQASLDHSTIPQGEELTHNDQPEKRNGTRSATANGTWDSHCPSAEAELTGITADAGDYNEFEVLNGGTPPSKADGHVIGSADDIVPTETSNGYRAVDSNAQANGHGLSASRPDYTVIRLIEAGERSAGKLVNLLAKHFRCFQDESRFDGRKVRLLKRAQIFVADLWAAFNGTGYGGFDDIDHLTMFADYRVPQSLHSLGVLTYSPPLEHHVRDLRIIELGDSREVQLRGCSIWAVELIRREILRNHPEATSVNAVLIDFFLYDLAKEKEAQGRFTGDPTSQNSFDLLQGALEFGNIGDIAATQWHSHRQFVGIPSSTIRLHSQDGHDFGKVGD
ncbi:Queuosine 5'-phosphate N-glycosylase/hydrolase [Cercospora zeina]